LRRTNSKKPHPLRLRTSKQQLQRLKTKKVPPKRRKRKAKRRRRKRLSQQKQSARPKRKD